MIVVADSSPLIFLAKVNRLSLLSELYENQLFIPEQIKIEILKPGAKSDEIYILSKFLEACTVLPVQNVREFSKGLSVADRAALTLALEKSPSLLLTDERLPRRIAEAEGILVRGTLGVLFSFVKQGQLSQNEAEADLRRLVLRCGFRVSVAVYEAAMSSLKNIGI